MGVLWRPRADHRVSLQREVQPPLEAKRRPCFLVGAIIAALLLFGALQHNTGDQTQIQELQKRLAEAEQRASAAERRADNLQRHVDKLHVDLAKLQKWLFGLPPAGGSGRPLLPTRSCPEP